MVSAFIQPAVEHSLDETVIPDVQTTLNLFGMHVRTVSGEWSYPAHAHPQYEINYVTQGVQALRVNNRDYAQHAGDLVLLRPGDDHSSLSGDGRPFTYFCIHFDINDSILVSLLSRLDHVLFRADSPVVQSVSPVLAKLLDICASVDGPFTLSQRMRLQAALFELFGHLWEAISTEADLLQSVAYEKVELARQIRSRLIGLVYQQFKGIHAEEHKHYGVDDVASSLGISTSHCNRVFRSVFGVSPRAFLSEQTFHEACRLLDEPRMTIGDISSLLGYRDISHFSRQFKRWSGQSPSEFRKAGS